MRISEFFSENRRKKQLKKYQENVSESLRNTYVLDENTPFAVTEAFRNLKASLSVAVPKKENGEAVSLLVTSNFPEEGKTTLTVNLSMMFATSDAKVCLIDTDIRKGRIAKFFKQRQVPGLSDYLSGQATIDEILHQPVDNEKLSVIYRGTSSPRPYELLESDAMKELTDKLKKEFDYIIYDTPPVKVVSDALAVIPYTDGTLLVCRHMQTYESDIRTSLNTLKYSKANVLGLVVNDYFVNQKKLKSNAKKYYYSTYSYSDRSDSEKTEKSEKIAPPPAIF